MKLNSNGPTKGLAGLAGWLKQMGVPLPLFLAWVVTLLETAGAALLVLGLGTRLLALGYVIDMFMAIQLEDPLPAHRFGRKGRMARLENIRAVTASF